MEHSVLTFDSADEADPGLLQWVALLAFVGAAGFCAVQAAVAPRRTFCSQQ